MFPPPPPLPLDPPMMLSDGCITHGGREVSPVVSPGRYLDMS